MYEQALALCISAHEGQYRRVIRQFSKSTYKGAINTWGPQEQEYLVELPYSSHPIAVANLLTTEDEKVVALLHDVVEDTNVLQIEISSDYPYNVAKAIDRLTKRKGQTYEDYITRIATDPLATKVKLADMYHNLSGDPTDKAKDKYFKAIPILLNSL